MSRAVTSRVLLALLAVAVAGCGSIPYPAQAGSSELSLEGTSLSVTTNGQIALHASLPSGAAAAVRWSIVSGTNAASLGQGQIDASGTYTAPGALSADRILVEIQAALAGHPQTTASLYLAVHPGLVQPLLPQNVALTPSAAVDVTAQIAEVNAGQVKWSLASTPNGQPSATGALGTLSGPQCRR
ncbi:MAG: hypothetical protein WBD46_02165, partial [Acidobacteriaceae bacterium]